MTFELYPAIDVRGGQVVRLRQGDYGRETVYGDDPVAVASAFVDAGARWVHVVDLDAAKSGDPVNRPVVARIAGALAGRAHVQTGGGVRTVHDVEALAAAGVARVVMGSAAVRDPGVVAAAASVLPVAVGLDHRQGELAVHGWTESSGVRLVDVLDRFPTASAFVVTDIGRDGMLAGPDVDGLAAVAAATPVPVIASGGVATLDDLRALAAIGTLAGVITGKALYEGRFTVREALAALAGPRGTGR
jgi:phosphoribosylformimino-5-aminoimidazole carboxamide ribotide isomerase